MLNSPLDPNSEQRANLVVGPALVMKMENYHKAKMQNAFCAQPEHGFILCHETFSHSASSILAQFSKLIKSCQSRFRELGIKSRVGTMNVADIN